MTPLELEVVVEGSLSHTFEKLTNFENFQKKAPKFYPHLKIKSRRDNVYVIEQHLILGEKEFVMMTKHIVTYPRSHDFYVIGGDCKGSHLKEEFIEINGTTKIRLTGEFKVPRIFFLKKAITQEELKDSFKGIVYKLTSS